LGIKINKDFCEGSATTPSPVGAQDIQADGEAHWTNSLLDVRHCVTPAEKRKTIPNKAPAGRQENKSGEIHLILVRFRPKQSLI
jgi:hypothetical protein